jgi:ATP-binding cassette subfamily B protein
MPAEKAKDVGGTIRKLLPYLRQSRPALAVAFASALAATVFSVVGPKYLGKATTILFRGLTDKAAGGVDFAAIGTILLWLCGLYAFSAAFTYLQQYLMAGIAQKLVFALRRDVQAKLSRLPLAFFDGRPHGEVMSRMTNDIDSISTTLQQSLTQLMTSVITIAGTLAMMLSISPLLTLIAVASLPLAVLATSLIARNSRDHFKAQQRALGELTAHVEEAFSGHVVVKAFGRERATAAAFAEVNGRLYRSGVRAQFVSGLIMPAMQLINNTGYVLVCVVGGAMAARRALDIGDIQAFLQYLRQFTMPIVQTATVANVIQSTVAAAERVFALLAESEETPDRSGGAIASAGRGEVRFEGVSFRYLPGVPLIEDLSIDVEPGKLVAIVGPTGAGKTTLVNLLMRFYEVDAGRITVDGEDIAALPRGAHRSRFGMVLQDAWLFNGSIRDNIAYGKVGASEEEIVRAAQAAQADHFIRTLPEGYGTVLDEEASNLSLGQKQLLTIARAILADPTVLILDEATSSVDTRTEMLIQKAMRNLMADRTSFVIAHRLSTIRDAALILVMEGGRIVEQGTHDALIARGGAYADLYRSQFAAPIETT